jgi:hypothetical protein
MFQNFQKVASIIEMQAELVSKFRDGIFEGLDPIFEKAVFIFYLIGYNFYEIELKQMI